MVAFESENDVYLRDLDSVETRLLWKDGTDEQIRWLFWAPDSQWLGIQSDSRFWRIAVSGGRAVLVAERRAQILTTWSDEGYFETCDVREGSFIRIPARGGEPRTVLQKNEDEVHFHPGSSLPGGKGYLFVPHPKDDDARTICVATADGQRHDLYESDQSLYHPMYSHTGHIVFWQAAEPSGIWALPFSLERLQVTGEPFLVVSKVWLCSVSNTGDLVYSKRSGSAAMGRRLAWVDRSGEVRGTFGPTLYGATQPSLSPDGLHVAVSARGLDENVFDSDPDIWLVDVQRGTATRLAMEEGRQLGMTWSPDGKRIAYTTIAPGLVHSEVRVRVVDGSGQSEVLIADAFGYSLVDDWSMAALVEGTLADDVWISIHRFEGASTREVFQNSVEWDIYPHIRPGGGLIAYSSGPAMLPTTPIFLRPFPEGEGRWRVSMTEARNTCWSRSGDRLFFVAIEGTKETLMEVSVTMDESGVRLGEVTPLFSMSDHEFGDFDVAPDGDRFLMLQSAPKPEEEETGEGIVLIENWFEEFRAKTK